jgi:DNA-binding FadR family transcriptional regulator
VTEHRQIFEAIRRGDAETARIVMLAHLSPYLRPEYRTGQRGQRAPSTALTQPIPSARLDP